MIQDQFKELWEIRFQRLLDVENDSINFYKQLLEKNKLILEGTKAKEMLEKILQEEAKHAKIAYQLLQVVKPKKRKG
ncbi:MAG: hypothetical protein HY582_02480 [Candidatus Omnitrophica bacterium]|nr:hypothetical protein [Candidatus Omnitrophota bacterium]